MADGPFRYQPAGGQQFYTQYNNTRHHTRPTSPTAARPSPSRSPGSRSPAQAAFGNMYNHTQHNMLNGNNHGGRLGGLNRQFQPHHTQHQQHHTQHHMGQDGHNAHQTNFISHAHNQSGGASALYAQQTQLQNGANAQYETNKPKTPFWQEQETIANEVRGLRFPHPHARNASNATKVIPPGVKPANGNDADGQSAQYDNRGVWEDDDAEKPLWTEMDMGGANLRCLSGELFDYYPFLTRLYLNNNQLTHIPPEIGKLRNLTHLDLSLNHISRIPEEVGMLVNLEALLLVDNKIEEIPFELGTLCKLKMLAIDGNPLKETQRAMIAEHGPEALIAHLLENAQGPPEPNQRDWIILDDSECAPGEKFTAISFNILCKNAATTTQFGYTPKTVLDWKYRQDLILHDIESHNADIVCLQEMDGEYYHGVFRERLARSDYKGIYFARGKAKLMDDARAKKVDGCATFVKNDKFIVLDKRDIAMCSIAINRPDMKASGHAVYNRVMSKDNIGVAVFLENRLTGSRLISVNTHLFWDQQFRDVKVVEAVILFEELQKIADEWAKMGPTPDHLKKVYRHKVASEDGKNEATEELVEAPIPPSASYERGTDIPMVVCGDFNSTPGSGVHQFLTTGSIEADHKDFGTHKYGDMTRLGASHGFGLKSSYGQIGELPFTNYVPNFVGVLDYILYSGANISCTGLLGQVDPEYLLRVPGFPNAHYPSDHLLMLAEFRSKEKRKGKVTEADFGGQGGKENRRAEEGRLPPR